MTSRLSRDESSLKIETAREELAFRASLQLLKDETAFLAEMEKIQCTACYKNMNFFQDENICFHSSLEVIICQNCKEFYGNGQFTQDREGDDEYCRWCADGGNLFCCCSCSVSICEDCLSHNFSLAYFQEVKKDDWRCFICDPRPIWPHRALADAVKIFNQNARISGSSGSSPKACVNFQSTSTQTDSPCTKNSAFVFEKSPNGYHRYDELTKYLMLLNRLNRLNTSCEEAFIRYIKFQEAALAKVVAERDAYKSQLEKVRSIL